MPENNITSHHSHDGVDDMGESLSKIVALSGTSIANHLISIQKHKFKEHESTSFVKKLVCFSYEPTSSSEPKCHHSDKQPHFGYLNRRIVDARAEREYVALSYTWNPSERELNSSGSYMVEDDDSQHAASPVRDCALARAVRYMQHSKVGLLWVDRHSVDQDNEEKKQQGVQAMHLVYSYSNHPVALLARTVYSKTELTRLHRLLSGKVVRTVTARVVKQQRISSKLSRDTTRVEAIEILRLLFEMSRDDWWTRAWTFQENYRAGVRMTLLIPHSAKLETEKRRLGLFGDLSGELCIKAVTLSDQATRLCQVLKSGGAGTLNQETKMMIKHILKTMGKYTRILDRSQLMTPKIISDIASRGIKDSWDRLPITANCCWFPNRLDPLGLKRDGHSLSLSILSLFLLNGGILDNGPRKNSPEEVLYYTTPQYLKFRSFNRFRSPYQAHSLTFNKCCRFHDVSLVDDGIKTTGHLWKLGRFIDNSILHDMPIWPEAKSFRLNEDHRQHLRQLELTLKQDGMDSLASGINWLLKLDGDVVREEDWKLLPFKEQYILQMALELAYEMKKGGRLRVGALWDPQTCSPQSEQRALFVWNKDPDELATPSGEENIPSAFAFTSIVPVATGDAEYRKDVNRHVSLEVAMEDNGKVGDDTYVPQLYIKNWLQGVCFAEETSPSNVIFPWPLEFQ